MTGSMCLYCTRTGWHTRRWEGVVVVFRLLSGVKHTQVHACPLSHTTHLDMHCTPARKGAHQPSRPALAGRSLINVSPASAAAPCHRRTPRTACGRAPWPASSTLWCGATSTNAWPTPGRAWRRRATFLSCSRAAQVRCGRVVVQVVQVVQVRVDGRWCRWCRCGVAGWWCRCGR